MGENPQSSKSVKFDCPECKQHYEAPEDMADAPLECQACKATFKIPRPRQGYYADPSEPMLEEAELYNVQVIPGMFRGQLKEKIEQARNSGKYPTDQQYAHYYIRQSNRRIKNAQNEVDSVKSQLADPNLTPADKLALENDLDGALKKQDSVVKGEAENKAERKRFEREIERDRKQDEKEARQFDREYKRHLEDEFKGDGDWAEFYRKPSRLQFEAIYAYLDQNEPGWGGTSPIIKAIDRLFPELRK